MVLLVSAALAQSFMIRIDDDGDGIPANRDLCEGLKETVNGYADEDGCPDYTHGVALKGAYKGEPLTDCILVAWRQRGGESVSTRGDMLWVDGLVPETTLYVAAQRECLEGQGRMAVVRSATALLDLKPVLDAVVDLQVAGPSGLRLEAASARWVGSSTPGCAPTEAIALPGGYGPVPVGEGSHVLMVDGEGAGALRMVVKVGPGARMPLSVELPPEGLYRDGPIAALTGQLGFETGFADIPEAAVPQLDALASYLVDHPDVVAVRMAGRTGQRGSTIDSNDTARARADAVAAYLASRGATVAVVPFDG